MKCWQCGVVWVTTAEPETSTAAVRAALGVFLTVHAFGFLVVARHHGARGGTPQSWWDLLVDPRWSPPLTFPVLLLVYLGALGAIAVSIGRLDAKPPPSETLGGGINSHRDDHTVDA